MVCLLYQSADISCPFPAARCLLLLPAHIRIPPRKAVAWFFFLVGCCILDLISPSSARPSAVALANEKPRGLLLSRTSLLSSLGNTDNWVTSFVSFLTYDSLLPNRLAATIPPRRPETPPDLRPSRLWMLSLLLWGLLRLKARVSTWPVGLGKPCWLQGIDRCLWLHLPQKTQRSRHRELRILREGLRRPSGEGWAIGFSWTSSRGGRLCPGASSSPAMFSFALFTL